MVRIFAVAIVVLVGAGWMLTVGANVARSGMPPLTQPAIDAAAGNGDLEAVKAILKDNPDSISRKDDQYGWTPLHVAVRWRHKAVAEALLANKADVNAKDKWGDTPTREIRLKTRFGDYPGYKNDYHRHKAWREKCGPKIVPVAVNPCGYKTYDRKSVRAPCAHCAPSLIRRAGAVHIVFRLPGMKQVADMIRFGHR